MDNYGGFQLISSHFSAFLRTTEPKSVANKMLIHFAYDCRFPYGIMLATSELEVFVTMVIRESYVRLFLVIVIWSNIFLQFTIRIYKSSKTEFFCLFFISVLYAFTHLSRISAYLCSSATAVIYASRVSRNDRHKSVITVVDLCFIVYLK